MDIQISILAHTSLIHYFCIETILSHVFVKLYNEFNTQTGELLPLAKQQLTPNIAPHQYL
jgi:hypothetical protein